MQKLEKANLYRNELIPINGKLVERYNKCLVKLGFTETNLTSFSIDGIGWSPEIAEEKKEIFYLNNGEANPHAILITPLQKGLPIYNPYHSFDTELMKLVFRTHQKKIQNITRDSAICIDFDQNIDVFYEPLDVLKYEEITIKFHLIDNLKKAKKAQLKLIEIFKKDTNFIDENIHQQLLTSAKKYGDLRQRNINFDAIIYTSDSFYTKAFGGIFVLRNFIKPILVFQNDEAYKEAINDTTHDVLMFHISQSELIEQLKDHFIIECNLAKEVKTERYNRIKKFIFGELLKETRHPVNDILEDKMLFKSYLNKIDIKSRKKVMSVERYLEKKVTNSDVKIKNIVDEEFYFALHKPHSSLRPNHQDLIWKLLTNISSKDVLFWYWYDKEDFYKNFKNWNETKKDWVTETICNNF
ncbi:MAG: hypothetical protein P8P88_11755 [Polaribacter sp.]|nr:hypothetical protein [Polaribacter sp.]